MSSRRWKVDQNQISRLYQGGGLYSDDIESRFYLVRDGSLWGMYRCFHAERRRRKFSLKESLFWIPIFTGLAVVSGLLTTGKIQLGSTVAWILPYLLIPGFEFARNIYSAYIYSVDRCVKQATVRLGKQVEFWELRRAGSEGQTFAQVVESLKNPLTIVSGAADVIQVASESAETSAQPDDNMTRADYYKAYIDERGQLIGAWVTVQLTFDKTIITAASATLTVSLAVAGYFHVNIDSASLPYLIACWCCASLTICLMLLSLFASQNSFSLEVHNNLDAKYEQPLYGTKTLEAKPNSWNRGTSWSEILAAILLISSIVLFLIFSVQSAPKFVPINEDQSAMSKENTNNRKPVNTEQRTEAPKPAMLPPVKVPATPATTTPKPLEKPQTQKSE